MKLFPRICRISGALIFEQAKTMSTETGFGFLEEIYASQKHFAIIPVTAIVHKGYIRRCLIDSVLGMSHRCSASKRRRRWGSRYINIFVWVAGLASWVKSMNDIVGVGSAPRQYPHAHPPWRRLSG
jgi:hypothetical protein